MSCQVVYGRVRNWRVGSAWATDIRSALAAGVPAAGASVRWRAAVERMAVAEGTAFTFSGFSAKATVRPEATGLGAGVPAATNWGVAVLTTMTAKRLQRKRVVLT